MNTDRDVLLVFDHYRNVHGNLYPHRVKILLSEISRIEPDESLNKSMQNGLIERAARDLGYCVKVKRFVDDFIMGEIAEDWEDWKKHISAFYKVTIKQGITYVISNKVESKIVSLMKKHGIKPVEILDAK